MALSDAGLTYGREAEHMKSTLLKATVLATAAIAMGALASPAAAKTLKHTFATENGAPYRDSITVTTTDNVNYSGAPYRQLRPQCSSRWLPLEDNGLRAHL
jgi:hypothetical protein